MARSQAQIERDILVNDLVLVAKHSRRHKDFLRVWEEMRPAAEVVMRTDRTVRAANTPLFEEGDLMSEAFLVLMRCVQSWQAPTGDDGAPLSFWLYYTGALRNAFKDRLLYDGGPVRLTKKAVYTDRVSPYTRAKMAPEYHGATDDEPSSLPEEFERILTEALAIFSEAERMAFQAWSEGRRLTQAQKKSLDKRVLPTLRAHPVLRQMYEQGVEE